MALKELVEMNMTLIKDKNYLGERAYHYQIMARDSTRYSTKVVDYANGLKEENERLIAENIMNQIDPEILLELRKNFREDKWSQKVREMDEELKNISIPIYENESSPENSISDPSTKSSTGYPNDNPLTEIPSSSESSDSTSSPTSPKTEKYNWSGTDTTVKPRRNRRQLK